MTTAEAAEALGISPRGVRKLIEAGILAAQQHGRDYWIEPAAVNAARERKTKRGRAKGAPWRKEL